VKDGESANFSVTVEEGTATGYKWEFEAPKDAGNNPNVIFDNPTGASTKATGKWFADPDRECPGAFDLTAIDFNARYKIKVTVTFDQGKPKTADKTLTVNAFWNPAGYVAPPTITGAPAGGYDNAKKVWVITGPGTIKRTLNTAVINVLATSQFYDKTLKHQQKHEEQWKTGMFSNLFTIQSLMAKLSVITDNSPQNNSAPFNKTIVDTYKKWLDDEKDAYCKKYNDAEKEAYAVSDQLAPRYLYHRCNRSFSCDGK
jgi:hypothetical protein